MSGIFDALGEAAKMEEMYRKNAEAEAKSGEGAIPRRFAIKSDHNNKYLRFVKYDEDNDKFNLQFTGERMISPYTKFELVYSGVKSPVKSDPYGDFYHIKCCYNNKYLVTRDSESSYIVAAASEPVKDMFDPGCTLFRPYYDSNLKMFFLDFVRLSKAIYIYNYSSKIPSIPNAAYPKKEEDMPKLAFMTIVDWDSIYVLPRNVAFKGDNGKWLTVIYSDLVHFSGSDVKDHFVAHEIVPAKDGVQIKVSESGKFWMRSSRGGWIGALADHPDANDAKSLFWPLKVQDNILALRSMGNNRICQRFSNNHWIDGLRPEASSFVKEARLEVHEIVESRTIDNVQYRLNDATVYGQTVLSMAKGDAINKTKETDTVTFKFFYEKKTKATWKSTLSSKLGVSVKFQLPGVPIIGKGKIEVSAEVGSSYEWGETHKEKSIVELTYPVTVPPMSRVKITAVVKQGMCQVPFSYRRTDLLKNGQRVVHRLNDGLFIGVNAYDYEFKSQAVPMK